MEQSRILEQVDQMLRDPEQTFILATLTADGFPDARLMGNICEKSLDAIYFTCRTGSRKTEELDACSKASITATMEDGTAWLYGHAQVLHDAAIKKHLWNPKIRRLYPDGPDTDGLTILRFVPDRIRFKGPHTDYLNFVLDGRGVL